ncbi:flagellar basal body rod protein FlgB [Massilia violaceinigra]|uniref:Flagellar basal body rod protein FlgB n=1 Tax=Massilia violaceinigra TaxID=2045208 RepID=A0A2D2DH55_9BURK|nr:flagellar basal body rod protein FlgB [Massilia violaceinigra]ATQ74317.1 flagellar basal body rod protein FlgB [Massilia violaceinigra]
MLSIIDSNASALLSLALDAAGMRQQAIAHNIANVNTPGHQRVSVSFESRMAALRSPDGQVASPSLADLSNFRPAFEYAQIGSADNAVALDQEMAQLSETTLHHQALLKALNKHFSLIGMAISEGKR